MAITDKEFSRRSFVAGAGAAAVGVGLTGALSGCATAGEDGGSGVAQAYDPDAGEWIPTTCNMCFNHCSILAHVVDGTVVELKGNPDSPVGWGNICGKGATGIMQLYDPNRITKPMKRTNPNKGFNEDPGWVEISWDEAYDLFNEKMTEAMSKSPHGASNTTMVSSLGEIRIHYLAQYAIWGASEMQVADICGAGVHMNYDIFTGTGNAMPDYQYCKYLIQFGTQAGTATRHGFNMTVPLFAKARAEGLRLVNFDPHMSAAGEQADLWVPIRPGTDAAAALAIANVLLEEDLIDRDYLTNRTNGPALVNVETNRIIRDATSNKALYYDQADGTAKPYDEAQDPALEGEFEIDGMTCKTGFTLYREHIATYTPEYQESITTVPAATIRQIAVEFGEAARIGETIEIEGETLPYRPACADCFSGVSRHKHSLLTNWAIMSLNVLIGSCNYPGGFIGYAPACDGWTEQGFQGYRPAVWEEDGFIEGVSMLIPAPTSCYQNIRNFTYNPTSMSMLELQPLGMDGHFAHVAQAHPELYHTEPAEVMVVFGSNPIKFWCNHDEQAEVYKNYKYVIGIDLFLNESSYFYDLFLPEATYLERYEVLPNYFLNHVTIGGVGVPWAINVHQPVVPAKDDCPSALQIYAELADRMGKNESLITSLNGIYNVKPEYSVPLSEKLEPEPFIDSVLKSNIDEEHGLDWFKKHGVYTIDRKLDEVYIWAGDRPGKVPLYWDFMLEAKEKIDAKVKELDIPWETDDYQPLPDWKPCVEYEVEDPDYDILPVYYTDAINTDSWGMENAWVNEINEMNPYGYVLEMNETTAKEKGIASGDAVRLSTRHGVSVEGRVATSRTIHPERVSVIGGHWGSKSNYMPNAEGKGVAVNHLVPGQDPSRLDHTCAAIDQCVRCKVEKIS